MKQITILLLLLAISAHAQEIKVMSYNIRLDHAGDGENRWDKRKDFLAGQLLFYSPDFVGVQEALPQQMDYLDNALPDFSYIGVGRDNGAREGEFSAIFYNSDKFKVLEHSTFWLSETPDKVSFGWDAGCRRICTYGLFEDKATKQKLWIFNTHFDHVGNVARAESAKLIVRKIQEINKGNYPVILTGDFNLEESDESIIYLSDVMNDANKAAKFAFGPQGTFNAFEFYKPVKRRIDYIFVSKSNVEVAKYAVLSDSEDCRYPSDHLPIYAEIILN